MNTQKNYPTNEEKIFLETLSNDNKSEKYPIKEEKIYIV